jgi:CheY-like chemotaxis protein
MVKAKKSDIKKVLVADSSQFTLKTILRLLNDKKLPVEAMISRSAREVTRIVDEFRMDLVILDLGLKDMPADDLLEYLHDTYPAVPIISMSEPKLSLPFTPSEDHRISRHFDKPLNYTELIRYVNEELESVSFTGRIHGASLDAFLQMVESDGKTCTLKINSEASTGYMHLHKGELIAADTGKLNNEDAAYEILSWIDPIIEIRKLYRRAKKGIQLPLMNILMEGLRLRDEAMRDDAVESEAGPEPSGKKLKKMQTTGKRISLDIGTQLQLKAEGVSVALQSTLVGMVPDDYLAIKMPDYYKTFTQGINKNIEFQVRYMYLGTIYIFRSKPMAFFSHPRGIILLEYPKIVEFYDLRTNRRVFCAVPFNINTRDGGLEGLVVDISKKGCRCQINVDPDNTDNLLKISDEIVMKCRFPEIKTEVEINGLIQNISRSKHEAFYGIEFHNNTLEVQKSISQFIYSAEQFVKPQIVV